MDIRASEDILLWADGTWCYRYEEHEFAHMSDDYRVIPLGTNEHTFISSMGWEE